MQQQTEPGSDAAAEPAAVSDAQGDASPPAFGGMGELPSTIQAHPGAGSEYLSPDGTPMRDDLTPNYSLTADVPSRDALSAALRGREIDLASRLRLQAQQRGAGRNHDDVASIMGGGDWPCERENPVQAGRRPRGSRGRCPCLGAGSPRGCLGPRPTERVAG